MNGVSSVKLTKEHIDRVRHLEGFPIAKDEDIIALSAPPAYTACPNPFLEDFIREHGKPYDEATDNYHREPFASDVSEGKNEPVYNAHGYPTKVPYKAIMRYILHYTNPGDIVFDGFCGTGMTGVAAQLCGSPDLSFKRQLNQEMPYIKWGARKAILSDLSPAATFITYNYNTPKDVHVFAEEAMRILEECEQDCGWMYETIHTDEFGRPILGLDGKPIMGRINYVVWSDVFVCPNCTKEIVYWDVAVDRTTKSVLERFRCGHCGSELRKTECERAMVTVYDSVLKEYIPMAKQVPVWVNYTVGKKRFKRPPVQYDLELIQKIDLLEIPYWFPSNRMPEGYNTEQPKRSHGLTHVHHYYTKRNLWVISYLMKKITDYRIMIILQSINPSLSSKLTRYNLGNRGNGPVTGTLYVPSLIAESNVLKLFLGKIKDFTKAFIYTKNNNNAIISCGSLENIPIPNSSIDYIFTDPPFGWNLNYSELNFIWESWFKVFTNNKPEAIVNTFHRKGLPEYQNLMERCFAECYRILKPGRWMTVVFHNSHNVVWNAIQEALLRAGFIVADVRTLDKKQGSFKQVTTTSAVRQDLVISAYKPRESFSRRFLERAGSDEAVWDFVRQHLDNLPVVVESKSGKIEIIAERQAYLLFDRMVAFHVQNGIAVPLDAGDFYKGLKERFIERDGMYFLPDQVNIYDEKRIRMELEKDEQLSLVVTDEKSAIQWLYLELKEPQTYQELQPKFLREYRKSRHEKMPELMTILEENFLQDDQERWYIPDVNKASDLAKLREKRLVREFEEYVQGTGKLKVFRTEAVRAGFDHCWKRRDFETIVRVAKRLPENVIQEDPALLMYVDNAANMLDR